MIRETRDSGAPNMNANVPFVAPTTPPFDEKIVLRGIYRDWGVGELADA
jgi:hypothetical protein